MAISITVSRKMLVATLLFALLLWGASLALAVYDLNIIHACLDDKENLNCADKNGSYKSDETLVDLVTEAALQAQMDSLQAKIEALQTQASINAATLKHFNTIGNDIYIEGANLHVVNGTGSTDGEVNGLGNVIIGYNEPRANFDNDRSGSHMLVVGKYNNYSSFGGIVVGFHNETSGIGYSSVSGGSNNEASGLWSSISGGFDNTASGLDSSLSGGNGNTASGSFSSVSGGRDNEANGIDFVVSSGYNNTTSGFAASVSGGHGNNASGSFSSVSGGRTTRPAVITPPSVGEGTTWPMALPPPSAGGTLYMFGEPMIGPKAVSYYRKRLFRDALVISRPRFSSKLVMIHMRLLRPLR